MIIVLLYLHDQSFLGFILRLVLQLTLQSLELLQEFIKFQLQIRKEIVKS